MGRILLMYEMLGLFVFAENYELSVYSNYVAT